MLSCVKKSIFSDYINCISAIDINTVDGVKRNTHLTRTIIKSYSRNISTIAKKTKLLSDVKEEFPILSIITLELYLEALSRLYVIEGIALVERKVDIKVAFL